MSLPPVVIGAQLPNTVVAAMDMLFGIRGWETVPGAITVSLDAAAPGGRPSVLTAPIWPPPTRWFYEAVNPWAAAPAGSLSLPQAVSTVEFPAPEVVRGRRPRRGTGTPSRNVRRRRGSPTVPDEVRPLCCVCLDPVEDDAAQLPECQHTLHARCLWGVLTPACLGASSMMRCPLCRHPLDRPALVALGYDVGPRTLARVAHACQAYRQLLSGNPATETGPRADEAPAAPLVRAIRAAATLTARDGFVYNTCLLALERMIRHKRTLSHSLAQQLAAWHAAPPADETVTFDAVLAASVACHVDVLIHSAHLPAEVGGVDAFLLGL